MQTLLLTPVAQIDPAAIYAESAVAVALDITLAAMRGARRRGELRYVRRGQRVLIRGRDLLDWLTPPEAEKGVAHAAR